MGLFSTHPLPNEKQKQYYAIAYTVLSTVRKATASGIKNYIEYCTGQSCDMGTLKKVLKFFNDDLFRKDGQEKVYTLYSDEKSVFVNYLHLSPAKVDIMMRLHEEIVANQTYACGKKEMVLICYKDYVKELSAVNSCRGEEIYKELYNKLNQFVSTVAIEIARDILYAACADAIKEYFKPDLEIALDIAHKNGAEHFDEGIRKMMEKISRSYTGNREALLEAEDAQKLIQEMVTQRYLAGDPRAQKVMLTFLIWSLYDHYEQGDVHSAVYFGAVAVKAKHFREYTGSIEAYQTVTTEECREFALNCPAIMQEIDVNPYQVEELLNKYAGHMAKTVCIRGVGRGELYRLFWLPHGAYVFDSICAHVCSELSLEYPDAPVGGAHGLYDLLMRYISDTM